MRRRRVTRLGALFGLVAWLGAPASAGAQPAPGDETWTAPAWMGEVTFLAANSLLGGLAGGIRQELRGGSFRDGFTRGALGGAVAYGGRRVAVRDFFGAGLVGRQVSATGASIVRNAGEGVPSLSRILVPLGPVSVYLHRGEERRLTARLDAHSAAWLAGALLDDRLDLDASASLSAGAPVFRAPRHRVTSGNGRGAEVGGVIILGATADRSPRGNVLAHERVHVLQQDFGREVFGSPLESWLIEQVPGGRAVNRVLEPGLFMPAVHLLVVDLLGVDHGERPWEIEAGFLEGR